MGDQDEKPRKSRHGRSGNEKKQEVKDELDGQRQYIVSDTHVLRLCLCIIFNVNTEVKRGLERDWGRGFVNVED